MTWPQIFVLLVSAFGFIWNVVARARNPRNSSGDVALFTIVHIALSLGYAYVLHCGGFCVSVTLRFGAAFWKHTDECKGCGETLCDEGRRILELDASASVKAAAEMFAPPIETEGKAQA